MNFIYNFFSEETVFALGIMLLHILWQGLIIAITLGLFLLAMRKSSAQARYVTSSIALALLPAMALVTFIKQLRLINYQKEIAETLGQTYISATITDKSIMESFLKLYADYLPLIVFLWIIGITFFLLKNLGALIYLERLKNNYVYPVTGYISELIEKIKLKFSLKREIKAMTSRKISSPMIIGHFKPTLLIPEVALNELDKKEIEVILHHELAHIKRNDYLVNIFQIFIETLFFFHPATWWISGIIRKEREECCDAYAVNTEDDRITLAKALTLIHQLNLNTSSMALTLINKKNGLFGRIKNIFGNKPSLPSFKEGIIVMLFFIFGTLFMSFIIHESKTSPAQANELKTVNGEMSNGNHLFAKIDSTGNIQKLFVEGKKISGRKTENYQSAIDSMLLVEEMKKVNPNVVKTAKKVQVSDVDIDIDEIQNEVRQDIREAMKEINEELGLNLNINDSNAKVTMKGDNKGFKMDVVDDEKNSVKMDFGENGVYMKVVENGKTKFYMNINENGIEMNADNEEK